MSKQDIISNEPVIEIENAPKEPEVAVVSKKKINYKVPLIAGLCIIAILGICGSYFFYKKYSEIKSNPDIEAQRETVALVSALGKLIELPKDETPTIAAISDVTKLIDQPFFKNALNGDRLFAYNTTMIAILYRPSTNKIINVAPITINQPPDLTQGTKKNEAVPPAPSDI